MQNLKAETDGLAQGEGGTFLNPLEPKTLRWRS